MFIGSTAGGGLSWGPDAFALIFLISLYMVRLTWQWPDHDESKGDDSKYWWVRNMAKDLMKMVQPQQGPISRDQLSIIPQACRDQLQSMTRQAAVAPEYFETPLTPESISFSAWTEHQRTAFCSQLIAPRWLQG